jgi:hypothetical protein
MFLFDFLSGEEGLPGALHQLSLHLPYLPCLPSQPLAQQSLCILIPQMSPHVQISTSLTAIEIIMAEQDLQAGLCIEYATLPWAR